MPTSFRPAVWSASIAVMLVLTSCGASLGSFLSERQGQSIAVVEIGMNTMWGAERDARNPLLPVAVDSMREQLEAELGRTLEVVRQESFRDSPAFREVPSDPHVGVIRGRAGQEPMPWFGAAPTLSASGSSSPDLYTFEGRPDLEPQVAAQLARATRTSLIATVFVYWNYKQKLSGRARGGRAIPGAGVTTVVHIYDSAGRLVARSRSRARAPGLDYTGRIAQTGVQFGAPNWSEILPPPGEADIRFWLAAFDTTLARLLGDRRRLAAGQASATSMPLPPAVPINGTAVLGVDPLFAPRRPALPHIRYAVGAR